MALHLYNTLTRRKDLFEPLHPGRVSIYTCGPTIYDVPQIGNLRAFVFYDVLVRQLRSAGYEVKHVMNLTDVDDKTIRTARARGIGLRALTDDVAARFFRDLDALQCRRASVYPRATETIPAMTDLIRRLKEKGHTYESGGSTYFRVSSFAGYGKLSGFDVDTLKAGARVDADEYEKEGAADFVLWKAWKEEDGDVFWETEFGKGRPGWHIECSAMSLAHLGETLDIHGGGVDLVFPHHENEIAQSEAATGRPFVRFWLHNGWLLSEGKKMSKSLKNYYVLGDVGAKGFSGADLRYFFLTNHYRQQFNFTWEGISGSAAARARLEDFLRRLDGAAPGGATGQAEALVAEARGRFDAAMDDDLNTAEALGVLHSLMGEANRRFGDGLASGDAGIVAAFLRGCDEVLGILAAPGEEAPPEVLDLVRRRQEARAARDFAAADAFRDEIAALGFVLEDTPRGPRVKKA